MSKLKIGDLSIDCADPTRARITATVLALGTKITFRC
jgi:hypothetical protein